MHVRDSHGDSAMNGTLHPCRSFGCGLLALRMPKCVSMDEQEPLLGSFERGDGFLTRAVGLPESIEVRHTQHFLAIG